MLLDKGGFPLQCQACKAITCVSCMEQRKTCPKCNSPQLGLFVPGYEGLDAVITEVDQEHRTTSVGAPGTAAAEKAKESAAEHAAKDDETVRKLLEDLQAPGIKFWVDKGEALRKLVSLGAKAEPALPIVRDYLSRPEYRISAVRVFAAVGAGAKKELGSLVEMLEKAPRDDAAAAALAIAAVAANGGAGEATPALRRILERKRTFFASDTGIRCAAAIALFVLHEIGSDEVTRIVREHAEKLARNQSLFPPADYLQEIVVLG